jgi:predicted ABC-type ATPase
VVNGPAQGIYVVAGVNGAGKTSIVGRELTEKNLPYFDPDEAARRIRQANPGMSDADADSDAWDEMVRLLCEAIADRRFFAFETTLGRRTIPGHLYRAATEGLDVRIWCVGLASPELHIDRVRQRVRRGGHPVSETWIRARYDGSRSNLIMLMPVLKELWLYDNSEEVDVDSGVEPEPSLIIHVADGRIVECCAPELVPEWAKAIVMAAILLDEEAATS